MRENRRDKGGRERDLRGQREGSFITETITNVLITDT